MLPRDARLRDTSEQVGQQLRSDAASAGKSGQQGQGGFDSTLGFWKINIHLLSNSGKASNEHGKSKLDLILERTCPFSSLFFFKLIPYLLGIVAVFELPVLDEFCVIAPWFFAMAVVVFELGPSMSFGASVYAGLFGSVAALRFACEVLNTGALMRFNYPFQASLYPTIKNHTQLWWVPNVVVAHQKEGIEAVHLASGRTLCKLHLPEGGLHADINGDGVLDHVQVVGGNGVERTVVTGSMEVLKPCWAVATSGVPVREQLFNASICHHSHFNLFQHGDFARSFGRTVDSGAVEVATPLLVRRDDGHKHRKGSHGDIVFLTSHGEVTSYSPGVHGEGATWRWQLTTGATWSNLPSPSGMAEEAKIVPTLKSFSLRAHDNKEVIIAGGEQEAVVISPGGSFLSSIELPGSPTHALVLDDFSGDSFTDIILVTSSGVYGFVQTRQPGALFFSTLVGCLIIIMGVIFVSQQLNSMSKGKPRASSEYR
ncbi:hypothetical protein KFK09_028132 [Dendrobium nobile]|uniref:FG-GAP repeat-containing protein n=1 Tax=Dendrobium nobile TaxID=94219 RepID=A0A8T3A174_DENNO|nr:hypothetical protein KFK09_028132 [Dendrobium nobile]